MDLPQGRTSYKKQNGILTISDDLGALIWTPLPGTGPPTISLPVANIANLQQTPDSSPKVVLKVIEKARSDGKPATSYLFSFTSPSEARSEANAVKQVLSQLIKAYQSGVDPAGFLMAARAEREGAEKENSASGAKKPVVEWVDDATLMADTKLQAELMSKDEALKKIYDEGWAMKPPSVSDALFNTQFWSTRTGLLRAFTMEKSQKRGAYNVLGGIKMVEVEKEVNGVTEKEAQLKISPNDIVAILQQYPLVCRLYNEKVPKEMTQEVFWSKFFLSKLSTRLKGERVKEAAKDVLPFDAYGERDINALSVAGPGGGQQSSVPHIIDLEGNEEDRGGFKGGNHPPYRELRKGANQWTVKTLNRLSETMMVNVAPRDAVFDPAAAARQAENSEQQDDVDVDLNTIKAVSLRDLQGDREVGRIVLHVKEQSRLMQQQAASLDNDADEQARVFARQVPSDVLFEVQADLSLLGGNDAVNIDLHTEIGVDEESDSDREGGPPKEKLRIGARAARRAAQDQLLNGLRKRRAEGYGESGDVAEKSPMGISKELAAKCYLTNATTTEFLRQFWQALQYGHATPGSSGTTYMPASPEEMKYHTQALESCKVRIDKHAEEAERELQVRLARQKQTLTNHFKKTGKKLRPQAMRGGRKDVEALFESTSRALETALNAPQ